MSPYGVRKRKGKWEIVRTIWPYEDGWGTYRPKDGKLLDSGLTKEEARIACKRLNKIRIIKYKVR
ncbi:MAG: hypothetical protein ACOC80_10705 [Petrotogales bacterium]